MFEAEQKQPNVKNLERFIGKFTSNVHPMATEPTMAGHAAQKKQFNHAFSDRALTEQESLIGKYLHQLVHVVRKNIATGNGTAEVDIAKLYNFTTFDIMGDLTFGEGLGQLETGVESSWVPAVFVTFKFLSTCTLDHNLPTWSSSRMAADSQPHAVAVRSVMKTYPLGGLLYSALAPKGIMEACAKHIKNSNDLVTKRLEMGNNGRPDIFGYILRQPEISMSRPQMNANAAMFMMSGTETTATALTSITWLLLNNPDKLAKVLREIRAVPEEAGLTSHELKKLVYMNAVIEEGMRREPFPAPSVDTWQTLMKHSVPEWPGWLGKPARDCSRW